MTIANFFNKTVYIKRLRATSGYKKSFSTTATADASIQSLNPDTAQQLGILNTRAWLGYFEEDTDIQEEDIIVDSVTNKQYKVKEITNADWGINRHKEVILEESNA